MIGVVTAQRFIHSGQSFASKFSSEVFHRPETYRTILVNLLNVFWCELGSEWIVPIVLSKNITKEAVELTRLQIPICKCAHLDSFLSF